MSIEVLLIFLASVILHECAHGWVADKLGDPTAKLAGRLTLNPLRHIDLVGTVLLPAFLLVMRAPFIFGWAKPVPVNFTRLNSPKRDIIWVGLAGPLVNIILAIGLSQLFRFPFSSWAYPWIAGAVMINLVLAVFNMLPVPPLDGSRLVMGLLPSRLGLAYSRLEPYGILIVFVLISLGLFDYFIWPLVLRGAHYLGVRSFMLE
jgi:Zn-dependent protease